MLSLANRLTSRYFISFRSVFGSRWTSTASSASATENDVENAVMEEAIEEDQEVDLEEEEALLRLKNTSNSFQKLSKKENSIVRYNDLYEFARSDTVSRPFPKDYKIRITELLKGQHYSKSEKLPPAVVSNSASSNDLYSRLYSLRYIADELPLSFAILRKIFLDIVARYPTFSPASMIDFGSGPATTLWATKDISSWKIKSYLGIEKNEHMSKFGMALTAGLDVETSWNESVKEGEPRALVVAAFSLSELNYVERKAVIEKLWKRTNDVLVVVEKGTPAGFKVVQEARDFILENYPPSLNDKNSSYVLAPCPHDKKCMFTTGAQKLKSTSFCHFSVRLLRSSLPGRSKLFHQWVPGTKPLSSANFEESEDQSKGSAEVYCKYSYVVLRKGPSPRLQDDTTNTLNGWMNPPAYDLFPKEMFDSKSISTKTETELLNEAPVGASQLLPPYKIGHRMSRIILPLLKRRQHVIADLCTPLGTWQRHIFGKGKVGRLGYRQARKSRWGDLWPFPLTNSTHHTPIYQLSKLELRKKEETASAKSEVKIAKETAKTTKLRELESKLNIKKPVNDASKPISELDGKTNNTKAATVFELLNLPKITLDDPTLPSGVKQRDGKLDEIWDDIIDNPEKISKPKPSASSKSKKL